MVCLLYPKLKVREQVYQWLTSKGEESMSVMLNMLVEWGYSLISNGLVRDLMQEEEEESCNSTELNNTLKYIQTLVGEQLHERMKSMDEMVTRFQDTKSADLQTMLVLERNRAEESARCLRLMTEQVEFLQRELVNHQNVIDLLKRQSNARGVFGENVLQKLLMSKYTHAEVENVGLNGKSEGDLHVRLDKNGHFISVESKNSKTIDASLVTKSIGHAQGLKSKHGEKYIGHLFVSLEHVNIPDKGSFNIDYDSVEGCTLVWLGLPRFEGNEDIIGFAFEILVQNRNMYQKLRTFAGMDDKLAYEGLLKQVREITQQWNIENEAYIYCIKDMEDQRKINDRLRDNMKSIIKARMIQYAGLCRLVGVDPEITVSGKVTEDIVKSVLKDTPIFISSSNAKQPRKLVAPTNKKKNESIVVETGESTSLLSFSDNENQVCVSVRKRGGGRRRNASSLIPVSVK